MIVNSFTPSKVVQNACKEALDKVESRSKKERKKEIYIDSTVEKNNTSQ